MRSRSRARKVSIVFLIVWMVFWAAGMILVVFAMGGAALGGDFAALGFMMVWLGAAGFALFNAGRRLWRALSGAEPGRRPPVSEPWHDGMTERPRLDPADNPAVPPRRIPPGRNWIDGMPDAPPRGQSGDQP